MIRPQQRVSYDVLRELDYEFLCRLACSRKPASIEEMNELLRPNWQVEAAVRLAERGAIVVRGMDFTNNSPRYAVTDAGRRQLSYGGPK